MNSLTKSKLTIENLYLAIAITNSVLSIVLCCIAMYYYQFIPNKDSAAQLTLTIVILFFLLSVFRVLYVLITLKDTDQTLVKKVRKNFMQLFAVLGVYTLLSIVLLYRKHDSNANDTWLFITISIISGLSILVLLYGIGTNLREQVRKKTIDPTSKGILDRVNKMK